MFTSEFLQPFKLTPECFILKINFINKECVSMYPSFDNADDVLDYIENYEKMDLSKMKISR